MAVSIPVVIELNDDALAVLAGALGPQEGPPPPVQAVAAVRSVEPLPVELPEEWVLVDEREGETYHWPQGDDEYVTFRVYEGRTSAGVVRLAIGACKRVAARGKDRHYLMTHYLTPADSKRPISEFLETDDYAETSDLIAIIKGKGGGAKMYDPTDELPAPYAQFRIETYRSRVDVPGSYEKLGIVAHEDDVNAILGHTLIQAQTRFGLGPHGS